MPELPEVETLRRGLTRHLVGRTITAARIILPKMVKGDISEQSELNGALVGAQIESIIRRGKYLIFRLSNGYYVLLHLKMRGQLVIVAHDAADAKYLAFAFTADNGLEMRFHDMWTWGEVRVLDETSLAQHSGLIGMGAEPLSDEFTAAGFSRSLRKRSKTSVKAALLDQSVLAGVGNIYADESLFRSKIRPARLVGTLTVEEIERLCEAIRNVLVEAIEGGGTTSDNYVDANGRVGRYTPSVYGRGGKACDTCGSTLEQLRITGRSTVYCPACQN